MFSQTQNNTELLIFMCFTYFNLLYAFLITVSYTILLNELETYIFSV